MYTPSPSPCLARLYIAYMETRYRLFFRVFVLEHVLHSDLYIYKYYLYHHYGQSIMQYYVYIIIIIHETPTICSSNILCVCVCLTRVTSRCRRYLRANVARGRCVKFLLFVSEFGMYLLTVAVCRLPYGIDNVRPSVDEDEIVMVPII